MNATSNAPFIYEGDGKIKEIPGFKLGTTSYLPNVSNITYMDIRSGEMKTTSLYDAPISRGNQISILNRYKWDNGLQWDLNMKYDKSMGSFLYQTPMAIDQVNTNSGYTLQNQDGSFSPYEGSVQSRMSCFNRGYINEFLMTP